MKILIEGSPLFKPRTGVGQYIKRLAEAMAATHPEHSYTVFGFKFWTRTVPKNVFSKKSAIHYQIIRFMPGRGYNLLFKLGIAPPVDLLLRSRPDIVLFPNFVRWPVFRHKAKTVLVVHDISFVHFPQYTHPKNLPYMIRYVPGSIKKSSHIIAVSESSKKQIINYYKTRPEKVSVVYPAVDHHEYFPRPAKDILKVRKKYKLPAKYILYAGTLEPRKNIEGILAAYADLNRTLKDEYPLVLAGGKGWNDESIEKAIFSLRGNAVEKIITPGYVPDEDLPAIYSGSSLFVYPSFYEGFGIPVLEAMACGVPVITADNTSLPEVAGSTAIMVKADDTAGITNAIAQVITNPKLAVSLRKKGLAQAQRFSWEKSAEKLIELFEKLAK